MTIRYDLKQNKEAILKLASAYGINRVRLFGSVARGEERNESDIDILINFNEGRNLFDLIAFKDELQILLHRKVDVVTENSLHRFLRDKILQEAVEI